VDYRKFLDKTEDMILPYLGGMFVHAPERRLRVTARPELGWHRFEVKGRNATPVEPAEEPESTLARLPRVSGHLVADWLFCASTRGGTTAERLLLMPEEEAPPLTPARGRRWPGGYVLFGGLGFDDEPEDAARTALEEGGTLEGIKGVTPSLRAAFGYARLRRGLREINLEISPREAMARLADIAEGSLTVQQLVDEIEARRYQRDPESDHREQDQPRRRGRRWGSVDATVDNAEDRAAEVLANAGADLLSSRFLGERNLEVTFRLQGERFIAVVDWENLHVYDSGICLSGADEMLGLDALPSVIQEAIDTGELYITRR
jgi:hypothetical protein